MGESRPEQAFPRPVTQIDESASRCVESIVPAVGILVLPGTLDPLDDLEEAVELHLTVGQRRVNYATLSALSRARNVASTRL